MQSTSVDTDANKSTLQTSSRTTPPHQYHQPQTDSMADQDNRQRGKAPYPGAKYCSHPEHCWCGHSTLKWLRPGLATLFHCHRRQLPPRMPQTCHRRSNHRHSPAMLLVSQLVPHHERVIITAIVRSAHLNAAPLRLPSPPTRDGCSSHRDISHTMHPNGVWRASR